MFKNRLKILINKHLAVFFLQTVMVSQFRFKSVNFLSAPLLVLSIHNS